MGADNLLMFGMIAVLLVFMFISSNKRKKAAAETASKVVVGAKVMLTSGIYGVITSITDDRIVIKSADSSSLEVARAAVARVVENASAKKPAAKPAAKKPAAKKAAK